MIGTILLIFAFVFACIAALFAESVSRPNFVVHFGWLAVAFFLASLVFGELSSGHLIR